MTNRLSGREGEMQSLENFLERTDAAPSVLVLSGEAGIGKTELWQSALERARARGARGRCACARERGASARRSSGRARWNERGRAARASWRTGLSKPKPSSRS